MDIFFVDQTFDNGRARGGRAKAFGAHGFAQFFVLDQFAGSFHGRDRKSTRLNSSHRTISYAVFCLKKKKKKINNMSTRLQPFSKPNPNLVATTIPAINVFLRLQKSRQILYTYKSTPSPPSAVFIRQ